jgi:putative DNA primase/helicase
MMCRKRLLDDPSEEIETAQEIAPSRRPKLARKRLLPDDMEPAALSPAVSRRMTGGKSAKTVKGNRGESEHTASLVTNPPSPWPKPVYGPKLLAHLCRFFRSYVVLPGGADLLAAAWVLAAWIIDAFDLFPHLAITSPVKRCGKSLLLSVVEQVSLRPMFTMNISPAVIYRAVQSKRPTILIDEAQSLSRRGSESSQVVRELLCGGIDRKARVFRIGGRDKDEVHEFSAYCPKVIAKIGSLDGVLADRCLHICMHRKRPTDIAKRWRSKLVLAESLPLVRKIRRWTEDNRQRIEHVYNRLDGLPLKNDRLADMILPLQAVLGVADKSSLPLLRKYAQVADEPDPDNETWEVRLLVAIREVLAERGQPEFVSTTDIREWIKKPDEKTDRVGIRISPHALARTLRKFGVGKPKHSKDKTKRGYRYADLQAAWDRYAPPPAKASKASRVSRASKPGEHENTRKNSGRKRG